MPGKFCLQREPDGIYVTIISCSSLFIKSTHVISMIDVCQA